MSPALFTLLLLVVAGAVFTFTMVRRIAPLLALRREVRTDRVGERLRTLLRFGIGQKRLVDPEERGPGLMHAVIFAAFLVLALRTVTLFGMGFAGPGFHLPLLAPGSPFGRAYGLVKDVMVLGALVGVAGFLWRRLVTKPDRVTRSTEGVVILIFIAGLMLTDMAWDASGVVSGDTLRNQIATGRADFVKPAFDWTAPAGSLAALAFYGLGLAPGMVFAIGPSPSGRTSSSSSSSGTSSPTASTSTSSPPSRTCSSRASGRPARSRSSTSRRRTRASAPRR